MGTLAEADDSDPAPRMCRPTVPALVLDPMMVLAVGIAALPSSACPVDVKKRDLLCETVSQPSIGPKFKISGLSRHMETYFQHFVHFRHHFPSGTLPS